ncbi:MAG: hypothetical protein ACUVRO_04125 [Armatimonadota bacterium]
MLLLAIDPGKTTGWASLIIPGLAANVGYCATVGEVVHLLDALAPTTVVVEAFALYPWRAQNLSWSRMPAAEVVGAVKAWCELHGVRLVEQPASMRKAAPKVWLEALGLAKAVRGKPHVRDAARHLAVFVAREYSGVLIARVKAPLTEYCTKAGRAGNRFACTQMQLGSRLLYFDTPKVQ